MDDKEHKENWQTIQAIVGSLIITPNEIELFKQNGIDIVKLFNAILKSA